MSAETEKDKVGVSETPHSGDEKKEVKAWLRTIQHTEKWRDDKLEKMGCKRFINEYRGDWDFLQASVSIPVVPINLVYAFVKTDVARMSFRDPWITVNPKRVEDLGAAHIAENVLNYTWQDLRLKTQIKQCIIEGDLVGHAWMKVGYVAEFGTVESQPKEKRGPGRPSKRFKEVETNEYVKSENVFAYYVSYKDILFDPSATYPVTHNARWMAHKIVKPIRAIKQSGIYEHTDEIRVNSGIDDNNIAYDTPDSTKDTAGKDVRSATLWEIYDLDHQTITTVSPGCDYKLREVPLPEYLSGGFPFVQLAWTPVPGEVYPMSEVAPHEGQIVELTKLLSIELNHLKRWNRQLLMLQDSLPPEEMQKFKDGNDGAIIIAQPVAGKTLSDVIVPVPYAPVQQDIYGVWQQIMQLWQGIAGQDAASQGGQAKTQTRTLGELRMQLMGGHARSDEKLDVLEDFIAEIAKKLLTIMQKKYDLPKLARIVGEKAVKEKILNALPNRPSAQPMQPPPPGQPGQPQQPNPAQASIYTGDFGFSWNRQDILGEMDVDVLAGSTVPLDREAQLEIIEKMFPYMAAVGITPGSAASKALAREFLRLTGIMSMEAVMDLADQSPPQQNPKMMEIQAKVQGKAAETKMKLQGKAQEIQMKGQEHAMKLEAMKKDLAVKQVKNQMGIQSDIVKSILQQFRPQRNGDHANV